MLELRCIRTTINNLNPKFLDMDQWLGLKKRRSHDVHINHIYLFMPSLLEKKKNHIT